MTTFDEDLARLAREVGDLSTRKEAGKHKSYLRQAMGILQNVHMDRNAPKDAKGDQKEFDHWMEKASERRRRGGLSEVSQKRIRSQRRSRKDGGESS